MQIDRRTMMTLLAAAGIAPGTALAAEPRVFRSKVAVEDERLLVAVGMNGQGPYIFMIDTGTYVSLIRPDLAKQLKLPVQGYERTGGVGGRDRPFAVYRANDFIIGGGIRQSSVVLEDSFEFGYRDDIYGALAAGILTAADTDLDFDAGELRIYPDGRGERPGFVAVDSEIPRADRPDRGSRKIMASVMLNGAPLRCELDTGSPHALLVNQDVARRMGLWDGRPYAPSRPNGIGGAGPIARTVGVESLALGGTRVDQPLVTLLGTGHEDYDGILGLPFIRRFNLSLDTRQRRLWVQPSRQTIAPPRYNLAGLWIERDGDRIVVADVGAGSPAAKAGIVAGDRIDGDWAAVLRAVNGRAGSVADLKVTGARGSRDVALTLDRYL